MPAQPVALQIEEAAVLRNLKLDDLLGLPNGASTEATLLLAAQRLEAIRTALTAGPVPVDIGGATITISGDVVATFNSKVSVGNTTNTPLGPNQEFVGAWEEVVDYASITAVYYTDAPSAPGGARIQFSDNGVTVLTEVAGDVYPGIAGFSSFSPQARYFRVKFTNGALPQSVLRAQIIYRFGEIIPQAPIGAQSNDLTPGQIMKSHLTGRVMSGPYAGAWLPVGVDPATNRLMVAPDASVAQEATLAERYGGGRQPTTGSRSTAGVSTIVSPALGKRIKTYWVSVIPNPDNSSAVQFVVRYAGGDTIYRGFAVSHWETFVGPVDAALEIETMGGGEVAWTVHYEEIN